MLPTLLKKIINSFLTPRFLFRIIIRKKEFELFMNNKHKYSFLANFIYFWPRIENAYHWKEGKKGNYRDPDDFVTLRDQVDEKLLKKIVYLDNNKNSSILDIGCNSGRHLNYLYQNGHTDLHGVDIMSNSFKNFKKIFPDCYAVSKLHHDLFQSFLLDQIDKSYEISYSVGATLELVHPSFDIISEICRVTNKYVLLLIQENSHDYPRFYVYEFEKNGFKLIDKQRPIKRTNISFLCFERQKT